MTALRSDEPSMRKSKHQWLFYHSLFGSLFYYSLFGSLSYHNLFGSLSYHSLFGLLLHHSLFGSLLGHNSLEPTLGGKYGISLLHLVDVYPRWPCCHALAIKEEIEIVICALRCGSLCEDYDSARLAFVDV